MEKIGSTQVQASTAPKGALRQAQSPVSEASGDFLKLLQQKTEEPKQPETSKQTEGTKKPVQEKPEKADKEPKVPEEETGLEEDLQQLETQQSILMQAAMQMVNPEQQIPEQTAEPVVVDTAAVQMEAAVEPVITEEVVAQQPKPEVPHEDLQMQMGETALQTKAEGEISVKEPMRSDGQEQAKAEEQPVKILGAQETQRREPVREFEEVSQETAALNGETAARPLVSDSAREVVSRPSEDISRPGYRTQENTVKSTVENLPAEMGKAFGARGAGEAQTLTVELEPASLGKLAIRLTYEAGRAVVSIMATNPRTAEILNEKASEIASILKERTGEETMIYTQQPEREPGQDAQEQNGQGGGQQQERQQSREEKQEHTESFMQQLRLGLV